MRLRHDTHEKDHPPPCSEDKCVELALVMPGRQWAALERAAHRQGLTMGQLLRRLIAAQLTEHEPGAQPSRTL